MDHARPDPSTVAPRTARKAPIAGPMPTTELVASMNWVMVAYPLCGRKLWLATAIDVNFDVYGPHRKNLLDLLAFKPGQGPRRSSPDGGTNS